VVSNPLLKKENVYYTLSFPTVKIIEPILKLYSRVSMEVATFAGMLGLGYLFSPKQKEGFTDSTVTRTSERTPANQPTLAGSPRQPNTNTIGGYDRQFRVPTGGSIPSEPFPKGLLDRLPTHFPISSPTLPAPTGLAADFPLLQMRPDSIEYSPAASLNKAREGAHVKSSLAGINIASADFTHNNMVPFFRGSVKQNMHDRANGTTLDEYTGAGSLQFNKREQSPMFEPAKEPMGNPFGLESSSDFMQGRIVESRNRANERPFESIRVGPGLNEGFTQIPSGGFQQQSGTDFLQSRMPRTDDLRVANNPKLTYSKPVVPGAHFITTNVTSETIGAVNKYHPDTFYINEKGERNFGGKADTTKPMVQSIQVVKNTTRQATTTEYAGVAAQAEGKATYTVGATRTPLVKQMGSWGYRNADMSDYTNPNTDASENDYGKSGIDIRPNERFYTGERVHATNLKPAESGEVSIPLQDIAKGSRKELMTDWDFLGIAAPTSEQPKLTIYDPDDVARTTIRQTTFVENYVGTSAPASAPERLTVYDPDDIARTTVRQTTLLQDYMGGSAPAGAPERLTVYDPDDVARTTVRETTHVQDYLGIRGNGNMPQKPEHRWATKNMRQYAQKERIAEGRAPHGSINGGLFNGEDNMHVQYRKIVADSVNDREPAVDRVQGEAVSKAAVGIQRPRAVLKLDVAAERNNPIFVQSVEQNPYNIALYKGGVPSQTAMQTPFPN